MKLITIILFFVLISPMANAATERLWIITNKSKQISLNEKEIRMIFIGATRSFPNGSRVKPFQLPLQSFSSEIFYSIIMDKSSREMRAFWSKQIFTGNGKPPKTIKSINQLKSLIRNNKHSIGYIVSDTRPDGVNIAAEIDI